MSAHGFTSTFAPRLDAYLAFKRSMGCYGTSRIWYLRTFDTYCAEHALTVFDRDTVEGWVREQLDRSGRYRSWMSYLRDFGRWLRAHGYTDAYVLSGHWKAPFVPACPYLLTRDEIELFFAAAAHLDGSCPWRWQAVAFFTLMHSCGIRTGEARALLTEQVDPHAGHIDIINSKGNRSRRLPVTGQVIDVLTACQQTSARRFPSRRTFFVSATGNQVGAAAVGTVFNRIWDQAALARPAHAPVPGPQSDPGRHSTAPANQIPVIYLGNPKQGLSHPRTPSLPTIQEPAPFSGLLAEMPEVSGTIVFGTTRPRRVSRTPFATRVSAGSTAPADAGLPGFTTAFT
jgi:integrase